MIGGLYVFRCFLSLKVFQGVLGVFREFWHFSVIRGEFTVHQQLPILIIVWTCLFQKKQKERVDVNDEPITILALKDL